MFAEVKITLILNKEEANCLLEILRNLNEAFTGRELEIRRNLQIALDKINSK